MKEKEPQSRPGAEDGEPVRDIRAVPKFTIAKAIGRMAGSDLMKGASPVTRKRQADLELKQTLERQMPDIEGALRLVLRRRVTESKLLLEMGYDTPLVALRKIVQRILESEQILKSFVNEVDAQWGRSNLERPHFEREGHPHHPDDPYTFASVRKSLLRLLEQLRGE